MGVRDWAAESEIVRTALRALPPNADQVRKVSALIDRKHSAFPQHSPEAPDAAFVGAQKGKNA
jgi:hypothetical protein